MKIRSKNPVSREEISSLYGMGIKRPAWKAVAKALNRPRRISYEINLGRLDRHARKGENIVVPGTVMGSGSITKPLIIAANRFTESAAGKIKKAGGKCLTIEEMVKQNPEAKKVRIMG